MHGLSNAQFYRFPVGQISRNLNTTRRSLSRWILMEQNFENFPIHSVHSVQETTKFSWLGRQWRSTIVHIIYFKENIKQKLDSIDS